MTIKYKSTRGLEKGKSFEQVVLGGLALDKGLYVPESIPFLTVEDIEKVKLFLAQTLILIFYLA